SSIFQVVNKEFDIIELRPNSFSKGLVIPLMRTYGNGMDTFTFAIDFGTTNTHIEYKVNNGEPQPFDITEQDMQIGSIYYNNAETAELNKRARATLGLSIDSLTELVPMELMPEKIGKGYEFSFPTRTVI